jgi:predicted nucleic acid-binding protein
MKPTALLDACVLYPAPVRDILLYLASENLFQPKWSEDIHSEWIKSLHTNRPDIPIKVLEKTRAAMEDAFPDAEVKGYTVSISKYSLPDENDRHVLAAAVKCKANYLVTFNKRHFPKKAVEPHLVEVIDPDMFISKWIKAFPEDSISALKEQTSKLRNPPQTVEQGFEFT